MGRLFKLWFTLILLFLVALAIVIAFIVFVPRYDSENVKNIVIGQGQPLFASQLTEEPEAAIDTIETPPEEVIIEDIPAEVDAEADIEPETIIVEDVPSIPIDSLESEDSMTAPGRRRYLQTHSVVRNESVSLITGLYWDDFYLWPDMYVLNCLSSGDPDLIYAGEKIRIYESLTADNQLDEREKEELIDAYLIVYDTYRSLSKNKDLSVWTLLYTATKYDENFLQDYAHRLDERDVKMAQRYLDERGILD